MKPQTSILLMALCLGGCNTQELWTREGLTQASLDQDYAACQLYAVSMPKQYTPVDVYAATTTSYGGVSTTTIQPSPYSEVGAGFADAVANEERQTHARRLCMQAKGYQFSGTK
jgi:hypothetical protein